MNNSALLLIALVGAALLLYWLNPWFMRQLQTSPEKLRKRQLDEARAALVLAEARQEDWDAEVKKLKLRVVRLESRVVRADVEGLTQ